MQRTRPGSQRGHLQPQCAVAEVECRAPALEQLRADSHFPRAAAAVHEDIRHGHPADVNHGEAECAPANHPAKSRRLECAAGARVGLEAKLADDLLIDEKLIARAGVHECGVGAAVDLHRDVRERVAHLHRPAHGSARGDEW